MRNERSAPYGGALAHQAPSKPGRAGSGIDSSADLFAIGEHQHPIGRARIGRRDRSVSLFCPCRSGRKEANEIVERDKPQAGLWIKACSAKVASASRRP